VRCAIGLLGRAAFESPHQRHVHGRRGGQGRWHDSLLMAWVSWRDASFCVKVRHDAIAMGVLPARCSLDFSGSRRPATDLCGTQLRHVEGTQ
jgi:hypothetical protein